MGPFPQLQLGALPAELTGRWYWLTVEYNASSPFLDSREVARNRGTKEPKTGVNVWRGAGGEAHSLGYFVRLLNYPERNC